MSTLRLELDDEVLDFYDLDNGFAVPTWEKAWPSVRAARDDVPGADGQVDRTRHFGGRAVTMTGTVLPGVLSIDAALDRLHAFCHPGDRPWLIFDVDGEERRLQLVADGQSAPVAVPEYRAWSASWYAAYPYAEAVDALEVALRPPASGSGTLVATALAIPFLLPATASSSTIKVVNDGSQRASWSARIYGPAVNPVITNLRTGEAIVFAGLTIAAGDYVELDQRNKTVLANGDPAANRFATLNVAATRWFPMYRGDNPLAFTCTTPGATTYVAVTVRAHYL